MNRAAFVLVASMIVGTVPVLSQSPDAPRFEVASVRLSTAPGTRMSQRMTDTRVDLTNMPLRSLLLLAFRSKEYQLAGPNWLADVRIDVHGTMAAGVTRIQVPEMLQRLLADRFQLKFHRESRQVDAYELVVSPSGHKMREVPPVDEFTKSFPVSEVAKQFGTVELMDTVVDTTEGPVRTVIGDDLGRTILTPRSMYKLTLNVQRRSQRLDATRMTMAELATLLANNMDEPVLDRTNLHGLYQFSVELPIDATIFRMARSQGLAVESSGFSESRAVEGLGLKLQPRRLPVDTIVVDQIARAPTEN